MPTVPAAEKGTPPVLATQPEHAQHVFDMLTLAFAADPANRWMYPSPQQYLRYFPAFARALGGAAFERRTAFVCQDYSGAALWLPPDAGPDGQALAALAEESVEPQKKADLFAVFEEMGRRHPAEPHWYLPLIGVDPMRQGQGLGAALLQPVLEQCDAARLPAYLESTNPRNRPLYERHGFEATGEIRIGTCPPIVPMLRKPA
ncbi:MAG: GNAT family N-acetyltransferase [Hyphomicrobiaceae bacterium]